MNVYAMWIYKIKLMIRQLFKSALYTQNKRVALNRTLWPQIVQWQKNQKNYVENRITKMYDMKMLYRFKHLTAFFLNSSTVLILSHLLFT